MTARFFLNMLLVAAMTVCCAAPAQDEPPTDKQEPKKATAKKLAPKKKRALGGLKPVAKAIAQLDPFNAEPDYKAKYYIYLQSASWCGMCKVLLPKVIEAYPAMKEKKVELIIVGEDHTLDEAHKYMENTEAPFASVYGVDPRISTLPGYKRSQGIPAATIVDEKGKVIASGSGQLALKWESEIFEKKKKK